MLHKYLDPHLVMYSRAQWEDTSEFARIVSLNRLMVQIDNYETEMGGPRFFFKFQTSSDLLGKVWEYQPFRNEPNTRSFYRKMFTLRIWPALVRRFVECPAAECEDSGEESGTPEPTDIGDELDGIFQELLQVCASCNQRNRVLFYHKGRSSVRNPSPFFERAIDIDVKEDETIGLHAAVSCLEIWPEINETFSRQRRLMAALRCLKHELAERDAEWDRQELGKSIITQNFWNTLRRADLGNNIDRYRRRILECLLQIITGRDVDIEEHDMAPQVIEWNSTPHSKWNAYVFKMGIGTGDRRCSRIYYSKITGGILLNEYCEDAHP
jgi:hypothetical protein